MCSDLIMNDTVVANIFEQASAILKVNLRDKISNGQLAELTLSEMAQPIVLTTSYALFQSFIQKVDHDPEYLIGHSLGEITALLASKALSLKDAIIFAKERGKLMHQAFIRNMGHASIVVNIDIKKLTQLVESIKPHLDVSISAYNSPNQFVVAGSAEGLRILDKKVQRYYGEVIPFKMIPMKSDAPYHTKRMNFLRRKLHDILNTICFKTPQQKIYSSVTNTIIDSAKKAKQILLQQLTSPVLWLQVIKALISEKIELFIDIGPNDIMKNLIQDMSGIAKVFAYDNSIDRASLFSAS